MKVFKVLAYIFLIFMISSCSDDEQSVQSVEVSTANNHLPIAESASFTLLNTEEKSFTLTAFDKDGDRLDYTLIRYPEHGSLEGTPPSLRYKSKSGFVGLDSLAFRVNDGKDSSNDGVISLSIGDANGVKRVRLSGKVTYDFIHKNSNYKGLNFNNIEKKPAKGVLVEAINSEDDVISNTYTTKEGEYFFELPKDEMIKIRVLARLFHSDDASWDMRVVDNTNNNALYVMEGALLSVGDKESFRDLHASSGWDGSQFSTTRTAAPFAILDVVYEAIQKILKAKSDSYFEPLLIKWSPKNISAQGSITLGQIGTSHYKDGSLFILGDMEGDSDEYDTHVIAHEWGHYYENSFSRTDSIGGDHGDADLLDIRVAFSEGFGNAFAGMVLDDPIYFDTAFSQSRDKSVGFFFNLETSHSTSEKGWFNESSIQRILYDLYDESSDESDTLSLGFNALHTVLINHQKNTPAFTSIFSFITGLKAQYEEQSIAIDTLVSSEAIAPIEDDYGTNRENRFEDYPYVALKVGETSKRILSNRDGEFNKLSNIKYFKFSLAKEDNYTIELKQTNGSSSDPDFYLYRVPFNNDPILSAESFRSGVESKTMTLSKGEYLLEIRDDKNIQDASFTILVD